MTVLRLFFLFYVFYFTRGYGVKVTGEVHWDHHLLKMHLRSEDAEPTSINVDDNSKLIVIDVDNLNKRHKKSSRTNRAESRNLLKKLVDRLKSNGVERLQSNYYEIAKVLPFTNNMKLKLENTFKLFETKLENHVCNLPFGENEEQSNLDIQILALDYVEEANDLIYNISNIVMAYHINKHNSLHKNEILEALKDKLYAQSLEYRKIDFDSVCKKENICIVYPGFLDYFADLLGEILKLPNVRFHNFIKKSRKAIKPHYAFSLNVLGSDMLKKISSVLEHVLDADSAIKFTMSTIYDYILNRRRYTEIRNSSKKKKDEALRELFNMVDKALQGDVAIDKYFTSLLSEMRENSDIAMTMHSFVSHIVYILEQNWNAATTSRIQALVKIITSHDSSNS